MKPNRGLLRLSSAPVKFAPHLSTLPPYLTKRTSPRRRHFVANALTPLQTLTATRILPYRSAPLYNLIADIGSYPQFIPYLQSSRITSYSAPDPTTKTPWPRTADLRIGYGPYNELFRSAVYCLPYTVLEAVAGDAEPTISRGELPHYYEDPGHKAGSEKSAGKEGIFSSLLTRWSFKEFPFKPPPPDGRSPQEGNASSPSSPRTEVSLVLEFRFASAVYSALSQAAAPKVAGIMIDAFEGRAKELLGEGTGQVSRAERYGERGAMEGQ
ncbi:hypothetical protein N7G274_007102 [Stereocaulon virgatum]|uniref:Coenzyme Q-binding protein COQ10 START domain-containing protein n=1 Tax=Stereocaulon virgatum TaxID=373712 RepID=A0ABR4A2N6_9LECA